MLFDTFANLLSSIPTFVFPVFASYKALKTSDPALLTPWLMYWVVLACALLVESWIGFILVWIPMYSWFRLLFLLYLILPQTQGAKVLYQEHVHPFLTKNELAIDAFISDAHDRAKDAGLAYLKQGINFLRERIFGLPPEPTPPPPPPSAFSYTQNLLARFNLPAARPTVTSNLSSATSTAADFYTLLASAVTAATSSGPVATASQNRDLSNSGTLIPPNVHGEERLSFISAQRERLSILLSALDKEASTIQTRSSGPSTSVAEEVVTERSRSAMSSRKSETDFEKIEAESGTEEDGSKGKKAPKIPQGGSWLPWGWGTKLEISDVNPATSGTINVEDKGQSSGIDF